MSEPKLTNKYNSLINNNFTVLKERIRQLRKERSLTQAELINLIDPDNTNTKHSRISEWENTKRTNLPRLDDLLKMCDIFDVDFDYLVGISDIESRNINELSKTLNLDQDTLIALNTNPSLGRFFGFLVITGIFSEVASQSSRLAMMEVMESVINTAFTSEFKATINALTEQYINQTFAMDINEDSYKRYLENIFLYDSSFNATEFINNNFIEDGKAFIYNQFPEGAFDLFPEAEKYNIIIQSIVDIVYEYKTKKELADSIKYRLISKFEKTINDYIEFEAQIMRDNLKKAADYWCSHEQEE